MISYGHLKRGNRDGKARHGDGGHPVRGRARAVTINLERPHQAQHAWGKLASAMAKTYQRFVERVARTRLGARVFLPIVTVVDRALVRRSGGRVTSGIGTTWGNDICLLTTIGAKTRKRRTVPLLATRVGDDVILIASQGGAPKNPAWYYNLKKHPDCEIELHGERTLRRAREAAPHERDRLWAAACESYEGYAAYQARAARQIPVMILERITEPSPPL
jgi:F420H(2)-dependent quinone reductase